MRTKSVLIFLAVLFLHFTNVSSQEFYEDGIMKLQEISKDPAYGFTEKKAIKVGTVKNEYAYIAALTGPNGEKIAARRLGSCCPFKTSKSAFGEGFLDKWEITYDGLATPIIIYLNGYEYKNPQCPKGLSIFSLIEQPKLGKEIEKEGVDV